VNQDRLVLSTHIFIFRFLVSQAVGTKLWKKCSNHKHHWRHHLAGINGVGDGIIPLVTLIFH